MNRCGLEELSAFEQLFAAHGQTALEYLRPHFPRFVATKKEFLRTWPRAPGQRVLDLGAHWLHQSMLYANDGFEVVAVDLPITFDVPDVKRLAQAHGIELIAEPNLERSDALRRIPDDSIDIVLFTEIIEHITFNPVTMWRELYRVMKTGARIIVTTPNYYALRGRAWHWGAFLRGFGGGLPTLDILTMHTHAHHWKEFARRELIYYFCVLSPDFVCTKALLREDFLGVEDRGTEVWLAQFIERIAPFLRPNLHVEIELKQKSTGIVVAPHW